jgi:hypothetical protein
MPIRLHEDLLRGHLWYVGSEPIDVFANRWGCFVRIGAMQYRKVAVDPDVRRIVMSKANVFASGMQDASSTVTKQSRCLLVR